MRSHDAEAKLQRTKDLESQESEKSKRKGRWSLLIVIGGLSHQKNYLDSCKSKLELVSKKQTNNENIKHIYEYLGKETSFRLKYL